MTKPVVARLHGYAVGAGLQVALLADLRIASEDLQVGLPELDIGSPCITGSGILWPIAGEAVVRRLVLTGDLISAREAERSGLVHEVTSPDGLDDRVKSLVAKLIEKAETPMRLTKEWLRLLTEKHFAKTLEHATQAHARNFSSGELTKGAERFLARKR
jgi:enoyl-CoA hydratase/carnithine racemase